ncbi:MAG: single-stranded DNA-binding protein [Bacillales bacterium]|jgi:single-strand DNA-binding protein|nr:single-stranded DNA-binding protein [Bacillales bacterium]
MMNKILLVGRLTKDPAVKYTADGRAVCRVTLAVQRPFKNKNGEKEADFIQCSLWNRVAETIGSYCEKGSMVGVVGRLQSRSYLDSNQQKSNVTEVVVDSVSLVGRKSKRLESDQIISMSVN